jgi:hypothetical protein
VTIAVPRRKAAKDNNDKRKELLRVGVIDFTAAKRMR